MRDCPLRWCTTGSKRRTRRLNGSCSIRSDIVRSVNSDHDIQRNLMWSPSALGTGYPSVALRYSTYQMSPHSAKRCGAHHFLRNVGYSNGLTSRHQVIYALMYENDANAG